MRRAATGWPFLVVVGCVVLAGRVRGALDPEVSKPYTLQVVLSMSKHRLLTEVFRDQVERQLRDGLQAAAGDLVKVEVVRTHPRLKEVRTQGLDETLKNWKELTGIKTHFILIDYVDGQYQVQARQHDGLTGQASPVVRKERTSDRQFVARLATLLIDRDFGVVGTIKDASDPKNLKIQIKGSKLGGVERWLHKGEVFLIIPIRLGQKQALAVPDAYLQLGDKDANEEGTWNVELHNRYKAPLSMANIQGFRCLKIATKHGPLQLRFVQRGAPVANLGVEVRKNSFKDERNKVGGVTDAEGYFSTEKTVYDHLAFVTALTEPLHALIPVPLVDDRPVTVGVVMRQDVKTLLVLRRLLWEQQVSEGAAVQTTLFKELQELNKKPDQREQALQRAREGLEASEKALEDLKRERERLVEDARKANEKLDLSFGDQCVQSQEKGHGELREYITAQEKIIKDENDPRRRKWLDQIQEGKLAEANADFARAIEIYAKVLEEGHKDEGLTKHLDELKDRWKTKGPAHELARQFIYETWPALEVGKIKAQLPEARKALKTCREVKDRLAPMKFLRVAVAHAGKMKQRLETLRPDLNEDDVKAAEEILELSKDLQQLIDEAQQDLQTR